MQGVSGKMERKTVAKPELSPRGRCLCGQHTLRVKEKKALRRSQTQIPRGTRLAIKRQGLEDAAHVKMQAPPSLSHCCHMGCWAQPCQIQLSHEIS